MASSSKRAEMALEKIFDDEDSADVMDSGGESDLDRQVENESGDQEVGDDERPKEASASTKEPMAPVAGPSAPSAAASPIPPVSSAAPFDFKEMLLTC
nr:uncharacterized protein LOC131770966 isoform X3 [Pocillopora verrucosa]